MQTPQSSCHWIIMILKRDFAQCLYWLSFVITLQQGKKWVRTILWVTLTRAKMYSIFRTGDLMGCLLSAWLTTFLNKSKERKLVNLKDDKKPGALAGLWYPIQQKSFWWKSVRWVRMSMLTPFHPRTRPKRTLASELVKECDQEGIWQEQGQDVDSVFKFLWSQSNRATHNYQDLKDLL